MHARINLVSENEVQIRYDGNYSNCYTVQIRDGVWTPVVYSSGGWDAPGLKALDLCISCFLQTGSFAALSDESCVPFVGKHVRVRGYGQFTEWVVYFISHQGKAVLLHKSDDPGTRIDSLPDSLIPLSPPRPKVRAYQGVDEAKHLIGERVMRMSGEPETETIEAVGWQWAVTATGRKLGYLALASDWRYGDGFTTPCGITEAQL